MSDDIVIRLRKALETDESILLTMPRPTVKLMADEIERLRAEVERLTAGSRFVDEVYLLTEEGIKLWDKIQAVRNELSPS